MSTYEPHQNDWADQADIYTMAAENGVQIGASSKAISELRNQAEALRHEAAGAPGTGQPIDENTWRETAVDYLTSIDPGDYEPNDLIAYAPIPKRKRR